jgi:hypothetical protein
MGYCAERCHVCPVCQVRLNGDPTSKGKPCAVCRQRRHHRRDAWLQGRLRFDFNQARLARRLRRLVADGGKEKIEELLVAYLRRARLAHDVASDWAWAMLTRVAEAAGEERLEGAFRETQARWLKRRYGRLRAMTTEEYLALTVEGMRGHFSGPGRLGDLVVVDEGDRYVLSFDPCGTGGRMRRGDELTGSPPRSGPPYGFGFTRKA